MLDIKELTLHVIPDFGQVFIIPGAVPAVAPHYPHVAGYGPVMGEDATPYHLGSLEHIPHT